MNRKPHTYSTVRRLEHWVGDRYRVLHRQEARGVRWMADQGVPLGLAWPRPWTVRIVVLLAAVWLVLLLVFGFVGARVLRLSRG